MLGYRSTFLIFFFGYIITFWAEILTYLEDGCQLYSFQCIFKIRYDGSNLKGTTDSSLGYEMEVFFACNAVNRFGVLIGLIISCHRLGHMKKQKGQNHVFGDHFKGSFERCTF